LIISWLKNDCSPSAPLAFRLMKMTALPKQGRLVVKLQLGDEIRRVSSINPSSDSFERILETVRQVFRLPSSTTGVELRWIDSEGDSITIGSSAELAIAFNESKDCGRILKLFVVVVDRVQEPNDTSCNASLPKEQEPEYSSLLESFIAGIVAQLKGEAPSGSIPPPPQRKWRPNGPRGCRGSGKSSKQSHQ